jgi:hypothetical protein
VILKTNTSTAADVSTVLHSYHVDHGVKNRVAKIKNAPFHMKSRNYSNRVVATSMTAPNRVRQPSSDHPFAAVDRLTFPIQAPTSNFCVFLTVINQVWRQKCIQQKQKSRLRVKLRLSHHACVFEVTGRVIEIPEKFIKK